MAMDTRLAKLKQEVRGVILSSPRGLTLPQFLKDYKDSIGQKFPYLELGYSSINNLLKDIDDVVRFSPGYGGGSQPILIPVTNEKVDHINAMVAKQKPPASKHGSRPLPRRCIQEESDLRNIRKSTQMPLESKSRSHQSEVQANKSSIDKHKESLYPCNNGYSGDKDDGINYEDSSQSFRHQPYEQFSEQCPPNEYQTPVLGKVKDFFNKIGEVKEFTPSAQESFDNSIHLGDYSTSDTMLHNGVYSSVLEEELDNRPPTPGELIITEKMKNNFRSLLADFPDGILSSKFCKLYKEKFGLTLRFRDYGMCSLQEMIANLPDVFSYQKQRSSQNWILFDVNAPVPASAHQKWIPYDIAMNIGKLAKIYPNGIKKDSFLTLYRVAYNAELDIQRVGFDSLESFLQSCSTIQFVTNDGDDYILPSLHSDDSSDEQAYPLPPLSEMYSLWSAHFTDDECNPSMVYNPFNLIQKGEFSYCKVIVCDVINPSSIWLQMDEQRDELSKLMHNLNDYYDKNESKHMLDNSCAVMDLMCAVRFYNDQRWHRALTISANTPSGRIRVRYIDYGTENEVSVTELRKLRKVFGELPVQAINSILFGVRPKNSDKWSVASVNYLYELCFEKKFSLDVIKTDEKTPKLEVILSDDKNQVTVNDWLISKGYAVSEGQRDFTEERITMNAQADENIFSTILQDNLRLNCTSSNNGNFRPPPGYGSAMPTTAFPKKSSSTPSTCDRIRQLREEAVVAHQEIESRIDNIRQMFLEADVLEKLICKHSHEPPEELEQIMAIYCNKSEHSLLGIMNRLNQDPLPALVKSGSSSSINQPTLAPPPSAFSHEPVRSFNQNQHQGGFGPLRNNLVGSNPCLLSETGYSIHEPPPQMMMPQQRQLHQPPFHVFSPQMHQSKLVGPALLMRRQAPYVGNHMPCQSYQPPQAMIYPQNLPQWSPHWVPPLNNIPRGPHLPAVPQGPLQPGLPQGPLQPGVPQGPLQPAVPQCELQPGLPQDPLQPAVPQGPLQPAVPQGPLQPVAPQDPLQPLDASRSTIPQGRVQPSSPSGTYNSYQPDFFPTEPSAMKPHCEIPSTQSLNCASPLLASLNPSSTTSPLQSEGVEKAIVSPAITRPSSPENDSDVHHLSCEETLTEEVVTCRKSSPATPPSSPPCNLETSHLSEKQLKKLVSSDSVVLTPPPTNNWKDLMPTSITISDQECAETALSCPPDQEFSQNIINIFKEESISNNQKLDDEMKKLDDAIMDRMVPKKEAVNPIMKICIRNILGQSSSLLLLLVGDSVAVMFNQLFLSYCSDQDDPESYSKTLNKLKDECDLTYSIFYSDFVLIFEKLREEKYIDDDDLYLPIVNLVDVTAALDVICSAEEHDLKPIKQMFEEVSSMVLPFDEFWYKTDRPPVQ